MSMPPFRQPSRWVWPIDASVYDRSYTLTESEQALISQLAARRKTSPQLFDQNGLMKLSAIHPLYRLLQPILDVWQSAGVDRQELTDGVSFLLVEMQRRQTTYWAWTPADWLALIGPTYPWFKQRYHKAKACRLFLTLFSYRLMEVTDLRLLSEAYMMPLAQRLFVWPAHR